MKFWVLALSALGLLSQPALAAEWWLIEVGGTSPKRIVFFADAGSRRQLGPNRWSMWSSAFFERADAKGTVDYKTLYDYDCPSQTSNLRSSINYRQDGTVVDSYTWSAFENEPNPVAPDTIAEAMLGFACGDRSEAVPLLNGLTPAQMSSNMFGR